MTKPLRLATAGGKPPTSLYIEDLFSPTLYPATGTSQTITTGIQLTTKGGLVWIKSRTAAGSNALYDTARGVRLDLVTNSTAAQTTQTTGLTAFSDTGFTIGALPKINGSGAYVSWTFRKEPKFFDVVTYTGDASAGRLISHNLASAPGCIIVKRTDTTGAWLVWHRAPASTKYGTLSSTVAFSATSNGVIGDPSNFVSGANDSTHFNVSGLANTSAGSYVAYIFAHNAGGFGSSGSENAISCGSYVGNGSTTGPIVTLGYEPQYLMIKNASGTGSWQIIDNMRGMGVATPDSVVQADGSIAEAAAQYVTPTSTGFQIASTSTEFNTNTSTYVYLAIRRGPMRTPTDATKVFTPLTWTGVGSSGGYRAAGFPADLFISGTRGDATGFNSGGFVFADKLRGWGTASGGTTAMLGSFTTAAEGVVAQVINGVSDNVGIQLGSEATVSPWTYRTNYTDSTYVQYLMRRAPGFFDEVCYTGTGANRTVAHNLGVAPELIIIKSRGATNNWVVYNATIGANNVLTFTTAASSAGPTVWNNTAPTASVFTVSTSTAVNASADTLVAYLFASCPGVSKVNTYTGNGTSQTIDCGFTAGARFVMIKRTDATGDWWVWDTARGIIVGADPGLALNSTVVEGLAKDSINPVSSGFIIKQIIDTNANVSGGTYIFLAIA